MSKTIARHRRHCPSHHASPVRSAAVEALEGRRLFVAIAGTAGADVIHISQSGTTVNVQLNGVTTSYAGPVSEVRVDALGGDDRVVTADAVTVPVQLYGGDGHDELKGGGGHDLLDGGAGNDLLRGAAGIDWMYGLDGSDRIFGGAGGDVIYGGHGNDYIDGEADADFVHGNGQPDTVVGPPLTNATTWSSTTTTTPMTRGTTSTTYTTSNVLVADASPFYYTDDDVVRGGAGDDVVDGGGGNDAVHGNAGDDQLLGGDGNDRLYGGGGNNVLYAGGGDDVLVTIGGGTADQLRGQAGFDSFWLDDIDGDSEVVFDAEAAEYQAHNIHRVAQFQTNRLRRPDGTLAQQTPTIELNGPNLMDPVATAPYADFRARPLFGPSGPRPDDVRQGAADDAYFLTGLSGVARADANRIRQAVVDLGDGTYAVGFYTGDDVRYYRVDGDLPAATATTPHYAGLGHGGSTWVAIMEKAFAFFRTYVEGSYASLDVGALAEPFSALGMSHDTLALGPNVLADIQAELDDGGVVTVRSLASFPPNGLPVVAGHDYSVARVDLAAGTITLRNPWGHDYYTGIPTDANPLDGYITLTAAQFLSCFGEAWVAYV